MLESRLAEPVLVGEATAHAVSEACAPAARQSRAFTAAELAARVRARGYVVVTVTQARGFLEEWGGRGVVDPAGEGSWILTPRGRQLVAALIRSEEPPPW